MKPLHTPAISCLLTKATSSPDVRASRGPSITFTSFPEQLTELCTAQLYDVWVDGDYVSLLSLVMCRHAVSYIFIISQRPAASISKVSYPNDEGSWFLLRNVSLCCLIDMLSRNLPGETEENKEISPMGELVSRARSEPHISLKRYR